MGTGPGQLPDLQIAGIVSEGGVVMEPADIPESLRRLLPPELAGGLEALQANGQALVEIRRNDPAFDQPAFIQKATSLVGTIVQAQVNRQWELARPFMSPRYYGRWQPWAASLPEGPGEIDLGLQLIIARAWSQTTFDRIAVRVAFLGPAGEPESVSYWIWLRSAAGRGGVSAAPSSICTNCGAPVSAADETVCRYCGAAVTLLGTDWVVDDVVPEANWSAYAA
jgi:hypothetical protein